MTPQQRIESIVRNSTFGFYKKPKPQDVRIYVWNCWLPVMPRKEAAEYLRHLRCYGWKRTQFKVEKY